MNIKSEQLLLLLNDGQFHSGEKLGDQLKISRAAVWKYIQQLKNDLAIEVESISNKGYRLLKPLELLSKEKIKSALDTASTEKIEDIFIFNKVDSTNHYLMTLAQQGLQKNIACLAEQQTAGKGRHGRTWISPFGQNIYLSLLWSFYCDPSELMGLSLAISVAIVNALKNYENRSTIGIKWPNDIYWQDRKLAGILIEMLSIPHSHCQVVIGVGLNTQMSLLHTPEINQPWVTLSEIIGHPIERNRLIAILLNEMVKVLLEFSMKGLPPFLEAWRQHDILYNKPITLTQAKQNIRGIAQGISDKGELLVNINNQLHCFHSGEVSQIRK